MFEGNARVHRLAKFPQHVLALATLLVVRAQDAAVFQDNVDVADGADHRVAPLREMIVAKREAGEMDDGVLGARVSNGRRMWPAGLATHLEEVI